MRVSKFLFLAAPLCLSTAFAQPDYHYANDIAPLLEQYCVKCHGPEKQKSDFRLDTFDALMTPGSSEEAAIKPGFPLSSPLVEYLLLPKDDDYAMPPEDEETPTGDEILRIVHWIYQGANGETASSASLSPEALAAAANLRTRGAIVDKLSLKDARLVITLSSLDQADLKDLNTLAPHVFELRAPNLPESKSGYAWLEAFANLVHLDLSHGALGDELVPTLNALEKLQTLNLFGTRLTDQGFKSLAAPRSGKLYVGQTKVRNPSRSSTLDRLVFGLPDLNESNRITDEALSNSSAFNPVREIAPARQVSAFGIRHSFLITGKTTAIFDENGQATWVGPRGSRDGMVLENGNILLSAGEVAREYLKGTHQILWSYKLDPRNQELGTVYRLDSGNTLVVERGAFPRLLEIDPNGQIAAEIPLQPETDNAHMQTRMARKLPNGNYLVPHLLAFKIKEYAPNGDVVNVIATDLPELGGREAKNWPFTAIRLQNGNTLANLTQGDKTVEFSPDGSVAWRCDNSHAAGRFKDPCGGQRLPNGNTVIASYGQADPDKTKAFEVTPDKQVVWEFSHPEVRAHEIHILTTNGDPVSPVLR